VVSEVTGYLQSHPDSVATIIGRTDTVGTADYNMRLSHRRADAVSDALVYDDHVAEDRVETRWTGESRHGVPTGDPAAVAANRVVDIAIH
jgi:outer membrane protein OmpA-like peptidoglycan-associated protein